MATTPLFRDRQGETEAPNLLSPAAVEVRLVSSLVLTTSNQLLPCRYSLSLPARFRDRRWGRKEGPTPARPPAWTGTTLRDGGEELLQPLVLVQVVQAVQAVREAPHGKEEHVVRCGGLLHGRQTALRASRQLPKNTNSPSVCG